MPLSPQCIQDTDCCQPSTIRQRIQECLAAMSSQCPSSQPWTRGLEQAWSPPLPPRRGCASARCAPSHRARSACRARQACPPCARSQRTCRRVSAPCVHPPLSHATTTGCSRLSATTTSINCNLAIIHFTNIPWEG